MPPKKVFLTGPRACGKTTVGGAVVARLDGWRFVDLDHQYRAQVFRDGKGNGSENPREYYRISGDLLRNCLGRPHQVIALGGGTLINPVDAAAASELLLEIKQHGPLVLVLPSRVNWRSKRILFRRECERGYTVVSNADLLRRVGAAHFDERIDFFRANADLIVYGREPERLAARIVRELGLVSQ